MSFINTSNRLGINYQEESKNFTKFDFPIIDVHSHINGAGATKIYRSAAKAYGIGLTYSMTVLENVEEVRSVMGDKIKFIAIPNFQGGDPLSDHGKGYISRLKLFAAHGSTIAKFWSAPRILDYIKEPFATSPLRLDSPTRLEAIQAAVDLGMKIMVHVSDPDTWFATKYKDSKYYGTKKEQYDPLRNVLSRFNVPLIAAHMAGSPENLDFLAELLNENSNLYLDCSATKWMVRELSKHPKETLADFLTRFNGRILFGSDIVTSDMHLVQGAKQNEMAAKASTSEEAYDLYASRYWALRTLLETSYQGESPISDPDLAMVNPEKFSAADAPTLSGKGIEKETLRWLYNKSAANLFGDIT